MIARLLAIAFLFAAPALAHEARPLFVSVTQADDLRVRLAWRAPATVDAAGAPMAQLDRCLPSSPPRPGLEGAVVYQCADGIDSARLAIVWPAFNPSVTTLVRVVRADGAVATHVLPPDQSAIELKGGGAGAAGAYFPLGVSHILGGLDHLLFLGLLAMIAGAPRRIFIAATGFTIAHSITLALTALDVLVVSVPAVEAVIALSIVFLAAEIARGERATLAWRRPALVASLFGLAHGAGFASALGEIGLPQTSRIPALFYFNVGVEAGQIALLAAGVAALALARRLARPIHEAMTGGPARRLIAYGVGALASFWTIERAASAFA